MSAFRVIEWHEGRKVARDMTSDEIAQRGPEAQRQAATLTRADFCKAVWRAGIISADDAVIAARGEWPAAFADVVAALPEEQAVEACIRWAAASSVAYSDPLLQPVAQAAAQKTGQAAQQILDTIFNIEV